MLLVLCGKFLLEFRGIHCLLLLVGNIGGCSILVKDSHLTVYETALGVARSTKRMNLALQNHTRDTDTVLLDIYHEHKCSLSIDESLFTHCKPDTEHTAIGLIFRLDTLFNSVYHIIAAFNIRNSNRIVYEETS